MDSVLFESEAEFHCMSTTGWSAWDVLSLVWASELQMSFLYIHLVDVTAWSVAWTHDAQHTGRRYVRSPSYYQSFSGRQATQHGRVSSFAFGDTVTTFAPSVFFSCWVSNTAAERGSQLLLKRCHFIMMVWDPLGHTIGYLASVWCRCRRYAEIIICQQCIHSFFEKATSWRTK